MPDAGAVEQVVGRERRERVFQLNSSGDAIVNSRRRVNSTVGLLRMMRRRFWIPILLSIPVTLVTLVVAFSIVWLDPGPIPDTGNRWGFAILFRFAILIAFLRHFEDANTDFFFIAPVLLQFPIYSLALALANLKGKLRSTLIALLVLHLLTITITLLVVIWLRPPPEASFSWSATQQLVGPERRERVGRLRLVWYRYSSC